MHTKKQEWDEQAVSSDSLEKQVCRPVDEKEWKLLIKDIRIKLNIIDQLESLLDIGCGNALMLSHFVNDFKSIHGTDYSQNMIEKARELIQDGYFEQSEADQLNFEDDKFDRVMSYSIFHYFYFCLTTS